MILNKLNISTALKTTLADVPQYGEGAQITVTEMSIKGMVRQNKLNEFILALPNISEDYNAALFTCAKLMCVMVDPDTGDFLLREDQLIEFAGTASASTLSSLLLANQEVNPVKLDDKYSSLNSKKKKS